MQRSDRILRALVLRLASFALIVGAGCETRPAESPDGGADADQDAGVFVCSVQAPTACPDPPPRYADITPIVQQRCVPCHNGLPGGPWPLLQYSHLADWQDVIRGQMLDCSMPPPDAGVPMEDSERVTILTWILCGFLE
ncbi:MAG TPA: hypothetical protein VIF57_03260 [Polyangia bacterium]